MYARACFFPLSRGIRGGLVVEGVEVGLAQDLAMMEDEVGGQTAAMGIEDVLETVAPVPREELVVVAATGEAEEADADELAVGQGGQRVVEHVVAAADERMPDDADGALLTGCPGHPAHGARAASCCLGQIVH